MADRSSGTLTKQQEAFCQAYSAGATGAEAYRRGGKRTYPSGVASERARRLMKLPKIQARLAELAAAAAGGGVASLRAVAAVVFDDARPDGERLHALLFLAAGLPALGAALAQRSPPVTVTSRPPVASLSDAPPSFARSALAGASL